MAVHIMRVYTFSCDDGGCDEWSPDYWPGHRVKSQIAKAREQATADGWSFEPADRREGRTHWTDKDTLTRCPAHTSREQQRRALAHTNHHPQEGPTP